MLNSCPSRSPPRSVSPSRSAGRRPLRPVRSAAPPPSPHPPVQLQRVSLLSALPLLCTAWAPLDPPALASPPSPCQPGRLTPHSGQAEPRRRPPSPRASLCRCAAGPSHREAWGEAAIRSALTGDFWSWFVDQGLAPRCVPFLEVKSKHYLQKHSMFISKTSCNYLVCHELIQN